MKCPECGETTSGVKESRKRSDHVWRRRKCYKCHNVWQTIEIDKAVYLQLKAASLRSEVECNLDS